MSLVDDLKKKWESALNPEPYVQEKAEEALAGPKEDKAMRAFNESSAVAPQTLMAEPKQKESFEEWRTRVSSLNPSFAEDNPYYNLRGAYEGALEPELNEDGSYHLGSRNPKTGEILKRPGHETWDLMVQGEKEAGYEIYEKDGTYYSRKAEVAPEVETNPFKEGFYQTTAQTLFKEDAPETEEEREQRKKRERARNILFNFADIGAHIANMWGTQGGAASIDVSSMTDAHRKRMDIAKENRDRNKDAYRRSMYQAIAMDQQANVAEQARLQQRANRKEDITYRDKQDKIKLDQQRWENSFKENKLKQEELFKEHNLTLAQSKDARDEKVANARVAQLVAQSRSYKLTTPDGKNLTYTPQPYAFEYDSEYNGVPIKKTMVLEVPKELKGSFISIVYNEMVTHAQKLDDERTTALAEGEKTNVQMIRETFESFSEGSLEPTSSKMETAMLTHAANLGLQGFIDEQATRISRAYIKHLDKPDRTEGINPQDIITPMQPVPPDVAAGAFNIGLSPEEAQWLSDNDIPIVQ